MNYEEVACKKMNFRREYSRGPITYTGVMILIIIDMNDAKGTRIQYVSNLNI